MPENGAERSCIGLERIGVTSRFFHALPFLRQELAAVFPEADITFSDPGVRQLSRDQLVEFLGDRQAAVIGLDRFDAAVLDRLPDLEIVSCCSAGLDHIDAGAFAERGVRLGWKAGVNKVAVAELTLSLMIALLRRVGQYHVALRSGEWLRLPPGSQLRGRTVGIHGCGHIGQELVRLLVPFEVEILACDREDYSELYARYGVTAVEPDELWRCSEILTLHLPKNSSTVGLYSAEVLDGLRPGVFFLNLARGGLVDEEALRQRLLSGRIAAAALDVFAEEPLLDTRLVELPNVMAVPHIGASATEAWEAMARGGIRGLSESFVPQPGVYPFD